MVLYRMLWASDKKEIPEKIGNDFILTFHCEDAGREECIGINTHDLDDPCKIAWILSIMYRLDKIICMTLLKLGQDKYSNPHMDMYIRDTEDLSNPCSNEFRIIYNLFHHKEAEVTNMKKIRGKDPKMIPICYSIYHYWL